MFIINILLYLCFLFHPSVYQDMRDYGATCWVYLPELGNDDATTPPPCPYLIEGN